MELSRDSALLIILSLVSYLLIAFGGLFVIISWPFGGFPWGEIYATKPYLWPAGFIVPASGVLMYKSVKSDELQSWIEFGRDIKVRKGIWFTKVTKHDWNSVLSIDYSYDEGNSETRPSVNFSISLASETKKIPFQLELSGVRDVARTLTTDLSHRDPGIRASAGQALGRFGSMIFLGEEPGDTSYFSSYRDGIHSMRSTAFSDLEELLENTDEQVRVAVADALSSIRQASTTDNEKHID